MLKGGASLTISTGERLKLSPQDVEVPQVYTAQSGATDYPQAAWRPAASCNYTNSTRESSLRCKKDRYPRRRGLLLRHHKLARELRRPGVGALRRQQGRHGGAVCAQ